MSITFSPYVAQPNGTGDAAAPFFSVFGTNATQYSIVAAPVFAWSGSGYGIGSTVVPAPSFSAIASNASSYAIVEAPQLTVYGSAPDVPSVAFGIAQMPYFSTVAGGYFDVYADVTIGAPGLSVIGSDAPDYGIVQLPAFGVFAGDGASPTAHGMIVAFQTPGYAEIGFPEDANNKFLFDNVGFSASSPSAQAVLALLDSIAFHGQVTQQVNLHALIAAQIAFGDVSFGAPLGDLTDEVHFSDDNIALALYLATLLDSFAVSAELTGSAAIFAFLSDSFEFDASLTDQQQIIQALQDGIEFGITLYTGADTYTAWVMTPETRAMRSYSNYAFNSYAHFGGRLFAAKDDGIYVLEGDTDAGQAISASVRTGLLDFGSRQLKRVERAYLGYTAKGTLALRVTTTSPEGEKIDYTYRMVTPPLSDAPRETRIVIGKGLQSVYWAFELDNSLDGADFELHDMTVLPIVLSRKVR